MKNKFRNRILIGLLTGTVIFSGFANVFAEDAEMDIETIERMQKEGTLSAPSEEGTLSAPTEEGTLSASSEEGTLSPSSKSSIFSGVPETTGTDEKMQGLMEQLQNSLPTSNGSWSVYVCDLKTGSEGSINNHAMQAASLVKLYIMGAIYENYDNIIAAYGKDNVDTNLYYMITVSDNDAANTLTTYLGGGDSSTGMAMVTGYASSHGFVNSSMGRLLLHSNEFGDNYTSVDDCGHLFQAIMAGDSADYPHAQDMFNLLAQQQRRNKIPAQLSGVSVANKTGELDTVENDAGIIYNAANDLIIVFMSEQLNEVGSAQNTIASLSKMIYDYYNS
ncbi:MAG: serine hydrolase [Eubacteriales bacterium]|nr:serine hydrolase [Eubacteriales bacterium]